MMLAEEHVIPCIIAKKTWLPWATTILPEARLVAMLQRLKFTEEHNAFQQTTNLREACIIAKRIWLPQQAGTLLEKKLRDTYRLLPKNDEISGDGLYPHAKHTFELKVSLGGMHGNCFNCKHIRPHHRIDFYLLLFFQCDTRFPNGKVHLFNVPSAVMYDLVVQYGGYVAGTNRIQGKITAESLSANKEHSFEYSLTINLAPQDPECKGVKIMRLLAPHAIDSSHLSEM
jgi:hypothetical protein